jgi:hypothetical protein
MVTHLLAGFGAWFVAALALGIGLGKLISAHERTAPWSVDVPERSTSRAA